MLSLWVPKLPGSSYISSFSWSHSPNKAPTYFYDFLSATFKEQLIESLSFRFRCMCSKVWVIIFIMHVIPISHTVCNLPHHDQFLLCWMIPSPVSRNGGCSCSHTLTFVISSILVIPGNTWRPHINMLCRSLRSSLQTFTWSHICWRHNISTVHLQRTGSVNLT